MVTLVTFAVKGTVRAPGGPGLPTGPRPWFDHGPTRSDRDGPADVARRTARRIGHTGQMVFHLMEAITTVWYGLCVVNPDGSATEWAASGPRGSEYPWAPATLIPRLLEFLVLDDSPVFHRVRALHLNGIEDV